MMVRIGAGIVAHHVRENMRTLCRRDASDASPATADMRACKPCAVVAESIVRHQTERTGAAATVATIRDYAESRRADHVRLSARMSADGAEETAKAVNVSTGTAFADRASMVAPINGAVMIVHPGRRGSTVSIHRTIGQGAARIPMSHAWSDAWDYVAATTMGNDYSARVISHARKHLATLPFLLFRNDVDDVLQLARARAVDTLISALSAPDTIRHAVGHACDNVTHPCPVDGVTLPDGTSGVTYTRAVRCTECEGCAETKDNLWLTRDCLSPVTVAEHVGLSAFTGRALRFAYARTVARGGARRESFGDTTDYLTATETAPDASSVDLEAYGEDLARIIETVGAATTLAGVDVIGRNGRMSDDVLTMLAITTGNYTTESGEVIVSANQRRTALDKIRDMRPVPVTDDAPRRSVDPVCLCRWDKTTGRIARHCDAHAESGLSRAWRRALEWSVLGPYAPDHNRSGRGIGTAPENLFGARTLDRTDAPPVALPYLGADTRTAPTVADGDPVAVRVATDDDRARHIGRHAVRSPF